jgi:hypothetical protein
MSSIGLLTFRSMPSVRRLTKVFSHLNSTQTGSRPKVVVTRDLGPNVMPLLSDRHDLDVGNSQSLSLGYLV